MLKQHLEPLFVESCDALAEQDREDLADYDQNDERQPDAEKLDVQAHEFILR